MADIDIIFNDFLGSTAKLQVFADSLNLITIILKDDFGNNTSIQLSKQTAIRFHRELKKQISFIESEVSNG